MTQRRLPPFIAAWALAGFLTAPLTNHANEPPPFATAIEQAHQAAAWNAHPALACRVVVTFGGAERLNAQMLMDRHAGRSRFTLADGTVAVFDGRTAWVAPADAEFPRARFHLLTGPKMRV